MERVGQRGLVTMLHFSWDHDCLVERYYDFSEIKIETLLKCPLDVLAVVAAEPKFQAIDGHLENEHCMIETSLIDTHSQVAIVCQCCH